MIEIELEKTYLAKKLPEGLFDCQYKEIIDIYIPIEYPNCSLRLRKSGDNYFITKKTPVREGDSSEQTEQTIKITKEEYSPLSKVRGKKGRKFRYYYNKNGIQAEVDVFKDKLKGLVIIDFEFSEIADKNSFQMPDFCLADVTQDDTFAGGALCGKKYSDIKNRLTELGYKKISS